MTKTSSTMTRTLIARLTTPRTFSPPLPTRYVDISDRKRSGTLRPQQGPTTSGMLLPFVPGSIGERSQSEK